MSDYETLFIIKASIGEEDISDITTKVIDFIKNSEGSFLKNNQIGIRKLAYPIAKEERGFYNVLYYKASGDFIKEFEQTLRFNENIIKFLTVKYSNLKETIYFNKLAEKHQVEKQEEERENVQ